MKAKPIIDIMIAVKDLSIADECIALLQEVGYEFVPEPDFPERRFMRKGSPENRTHHISIVEYMGQFWTEHLLFRDYLRKNPDERLRYSTLKEKLAAKHGSNRHAYTFAKTEYIKEVIAKARRLEQSK